MMPVAESSVKIKITKQKAALEIKSFHFSACCCFKHRQHLYCSDREKARQEGRGDYITDL